MNADIGDTARRTDPSTHLPGLRDADGFDCDIDTEPIGHRRDLLPPIAVPDETTPSGGTEFCSLLDPVGVWVGAMIRLGPAAGPWR